MSRACGVDAVHRFGGLPLRYPALSDLDTVPLTHLHRVAAAARPKHGGFIVFCMEYCCVHDVLVVYILAMSNWLHLDVTAVFFPVTAVIKM